MTTETFGSRTGNTYTGFVDTYLSEGAPASNLSTQPSMYVARGSGVRSHPIVQVPGLVANITGPITANSAGIVMRSADTGTAFNVALYKLAVPVDVTLATWEYRIPSSSVAWVAQGALAVGDVVSLTPIATGVCPATSNTDFTLSGAGLTADFEAIVNGTADDYGYLLCCDPDGTGTNSMRLRATDFATAAERPYATLDYTAGSPGPTVTSVTQTSGGTEGSPAVMTVSLSGATSGSTNFAATLAGVTATGSGTDFTSDLASATYSNGVTFSGGNMVVPDAVSGWTVTIATTGDTLDEANETATLTVGGTAGTLTITDDDVQPTVTISDATEVAGTVTFVATLSAASGKTITFLASTADGTKTAGVDYTALTGSTVTFNPGETTKNIVVTAL